MTDHATYGLAYWINERYAIKQRRAAGIKPPWTANSVMASVRWCNVHREDDAVTKWMRQNWKMEGNPVWFWVLGRMLNYIPTLERLMDNGDLDDLAHVKGNLIDARNCGKVFTSAYTISTCGKSMDKIDYVVDWVVAAVQDKENDEEMKIPPGMNLSTVHEILTSIDGLGSFLAAQVVADLKNTPGHPLQAAPDWWAWAAPGPGSLRGLNWYFNGNPTGKGGVRVTPVNFMHHLMVAHEEVWPFVSKDVPRVCMQDFQNCVCEFSKYMKVNNLNGHVRNRYVAA